MSESHTFLADSRSAGSRFLGNLACTAGMVIGLFIDIWRSPFGMTSIVCGAGGNVYTKLLFHFTLMPAAHVGMVLGALLCVTQHLGRCAFQPIALILLLLWQFGGMVAAEAGSLMLFPRPANPILMMCTMVIVMLALGLIPGPGRQGREI